MSSLSVNTITDANGGTTATINGYTPTVSNMAGRNRIINGAMGIWQRGTSTTTDGSYLADRFRVINITSASQQSDAPAGFKYSLQLVNTGASYPGLQQRIESVNCTDLVGNNVTISFWAKNNSGSAYLAVELYYANTADNFAATTMIGSTTVVSSAPSSSWTYYTATFTNLPSGAANGLQVVLFRQNQSAATTSYTGVQLEKGSTATSFDYRLYGTELALCQRYYTKETGYNVKLGIRYGANTVYLSYTTPVEMRTTPTVANSGTNWQVLNTTASEISNTSTVNTVLSYVGGNVDVVLNTSFNPAAYIYATNSLSNTNNVTFSAEL